MAVHDNAMFSIIKTTSNGLGPRLGRLSLPGRTAMATPHYIGVTSRGVVPHLSPDNFAGMTSIGGVFMALEDFIERAPSEVPPVYKLKPPDGSSPLRRFTALPDETLLAIGARRAPPLIAPVHNPNTRTTVSISTVVGFKVLGATEYAKGSEALQADIIVSLADVPYGRALVPKRVDKMLDRSTSWLREHVALRSENVDRPSKASLFASLLPLSCTAQQSYLDYIMEEAVDAVSGLALHNVAPLDDLPRQLRPLPRLGLLSPGTPHEVLRQILQGLDISTLPFITTATDAGIAFSFEFPAPAYEGEERTSRDALALGIDMWSSDHAADLSPLVPECDCYACTNHHKAYVQHLLVAKEMLGWVLLQIHNHHIIDKFFGSIRQGIADGKLEQQTGQFAEYYESHLPEGSGQGPRLRGYQFSSQGPGEPKRNKAPYTTLNNDKADTSGAQGITVEAVAIDADGLEQQGFAAKEV